MLKLYLSGGISLLVLAPAWAQSEGLRAPAPRYNNEPMMLTMSTESMGPRPPTKLRDTLRQPDDAQQKAVHPYRLTPQERQLLREQLRQQAWTVQPAR